LGFSSKNWAKNAKFFEALLSLVVVKESVIRVVRCQKDINLAMALHQAALNGNALLIATFLGMCCCTMLHWLLELAQTHETIAGNSGFFVR